MMKMTSIAVVIAVLSLSACGRKGPLEAPTASVNPPAQGGATQPASVEDKPFILDGLIQ